jgi:hypothetical protein
MCQAGVDCLSFAFDSGGTCYVFTRYGGASCPANETTVSQMGASMYYVYEDNPMATFYTVGNGICGYLYDGGYDI